MSTCSSGDGGERLRIFLLNSSVAQALNGVWNRLVAPNDGIAQANEIMASALERRSRSANGFFLSSILDSEDKEKATVEEESESSYISEAGLASVGGGAERRLYIGAQCPLRQYVISFLTLALFRTNTLSHLLTRYHEARRRARRSRVGLTVHRNY